MRGIGLFCVYEKQFEQVRRKDVECMIANLWRLDICGRRNRGAGFKARDEYD
jgi:hypothetical protein